ncbi:radical SAM family heme chaperone HemW [Litorivicinus lipolyticus]|uniref:Heme chaperone HemW n=1 Tax=Litorivicinus lipolyticus TaxID=418701 RepID=A0A5Q2QAY3_9GAMM|nr:radical SAM family heme chaperone HemW [Litorivicinus lipolyticus]QGG79226.1 radical SAM family heme chaperone HemW [Litorivicinus lipolyticus]
MADFGVYVHLPWCERKCPYCDFNSHERSDIPERAYVDALLADLAQDAQFVERPRPITSVFFGGGTPSLFSPTAIGRIIDGLGRELGFADDVEITLEANPGSSEARKFAGFRSAGVNRLSLGIQSFHAGALSALGRIHDPAQARAAIEAARSAGFDNFNIDLMHGLPGQRVSDAAADLMEGLSFGPTHLSWYQLTIEPNTAFYSAPPPLPPEDDLADIQDMGWAMLAEHGFEHYEVSAFSQQGRASRHNLTYWQFDDYLGIGAGAHGKLTRSGGVERSQKTRMPDAYMQGRAASFKAVAADELAFQFMLNRLRLRAGCEETEFSRQTGQSLASIAKPLARARELGLMHPTRLQASDRGWLFLNNLTALFLPD